MLIDIHMLKNYPPTNLNRDETGMPKTCYFSGTERGRISSQCLKHTWRSGVDFSNLKLGIRTRYLPEYVASLLKKRGIEESYIKEAKIKLSKIGQGEDKKKDKEDDDKLEKKNEASQTKQIIFYSQKDLEEVANVVEESIQQSGSLESFKKITLKEWQTILKNKFTPVTVDIALFGRMVTDDSFKNVEASIQVSHAISTNKVELESDYFSAVDDLNKEYSEDSGSAMIGDIDYNSCCYYHYASLDLDQLKDNLKGVEDLENIIECTIESLIKAMAVTNPSGKQNSFAGHVLPGLICLELKDKKIPISYVNAFATPIDKGNYMEESIERLKCEIDKTSDSFEGLIPVKERIWFSPAKNSQNPEKSKDVKSFKEVLEICKSWSKEV